jgi:hypothetical protein
MKRTLFLPLVLILTAALATFALAGAKGKMDLKAGDEVYVCGCGEACPCTTMSHNAGKCSCGKDLVKAKVSKVEGDTASVKAEGWDKARAFKTVAKYTCACPPSCPCDTISQNPGKCTCGKDMKKVEG